MRTSSSTTSMESGARTSPFPAGAGSIGCLLCCLLARKWRQLFQFPRAGASWDEIAVRKSTVAAWYRLHPGSSETMVWSTACASPADAPIACRNPANFGSPSRLNARPFLADPAAGTGALEGDYIVMNDTVLDDARKAFLFVNSAHTLSAVTFDRDGRNLPHPRVCQWNFAREFQLGVQEVTPFGIDPEPILRGMAANGYFVWPVENMQPFGTSQ